jgi:pantoate--beta-alanine ligase
VVLKLLAMVRPDVAVFGEKDAQQVALVRRMTEDFALGIEIDGVPTVRDPDGLAISSRNRFLSAAERRSALALSAALRAGRAAAPAGPAGVLKAAHQVLDAVPAVAPDYLALVDPATFEQVDEGFAGSALLLTAVRVGATRLIDNTPLTLGGQLDTREHHAADD